MGKYCVNCGKELVDNENTCSNCGFIINNNDKASNLGLTGFILGLVGIFAWLLPFIGYPVTICGIVFSSKGLKSNNRGKSITGLVLSIIFCIFTLLNSFAGLVMFMEAFYY